MYGFNIARTLKNARKKSRLSVAEVSEFLTDKGFKALEKTVYSWESGNSQPNPDILLELCNLYNIKDILREFSDRDNSDSIDLESKKEPAPETDSLEWLRQGLLETGVIKNSDELSERQLEATFGVMEIFVKNLKKVNEK